MIEVYARSSYRAGGNIGDLSVRQAGSNESNESIRELHLVGLSIKSKILRDNLQETTVGAIASERSSREEKDPVGHRKESALL